MLEVLEQYFGELGTQERVGFILKDGSIIEVKNMSSDPANSFDVSGEDLLKYADAAQATWHTHPGGTSNLSVGDYSSFLNYPHLEHWIISPNGMKKYVVRKNAVINCPIQLQ